MADAVGATASSSDAGSMFDMVPDMNDIHAAHAGHAGHAGHNHGGGSGTGMEHMMPMAVRYLTWRLFRNP